jgi:hypothetical protein
VYTVTPLSLIYRNKGELSKINGLRKGGWGFELEGKRGVFAWNWGWWKMGARVMGWTV